MGSRVRRFAPLSADVDAAATEVDGKMVLKGVVFDMDGTLCLPQNHMFADMRSALGIPPSVDILTHIYSLPSSEQPAAHAAIQAIERREMARQQPQAGLVSLMEYLDRRGLRKGICTRNFDTPVTHLLTTHLPGHIEAFAPIVTREFRPPKPSPAGILHIAKAWGVVDEEDVVDGKLVGGPQREIPLIMVGDSVDDIEAGFEAGAATVLVRSAGKEELERDPRTDVVVDRLDDLIEILEKGFVGKPRS